MSEAGPAEDATAHAGGLAIETQGLTKTFGKRTAVDGIDLAVPAGSVFGFLGPNGSGKTTTIRLLLGLANADAGTMMVLRKPVPERVLDVLPGVGALVEGPAFYPYLSGRANLIRCDAANRHTPAATRKARVDTALERVGLSRARHLAVHAYSLGMKQRLGIANALVSPRELLVLDEPTNGLDPQGTREVRSLIRTLAGEGATVFVSSHLLSEIEQMCTHAAIMSRGRLVGQGSLERLRAGGTARVRIRTPDAGAARAVLTQLGITATAPADGAVADGAVADGAGADGDVVRAPLADGGAEPEEIVAALVAGGVRVRGFEVEHASLEDRFVALTGEGFDLVQ